MLLAKLTTKKVEGGLTLISRRTAYQTKESQAVHQQGVMMPAEVQALAVILQCAGNMVLASSRTTAQY